MKYLSFFLCPVVVMFLIFATVYFISFVWFVVALPHLPQWKQFWWGFNETIFIILLFFLNRISTLSWSVFLRPTHRREWGEVTNIKNLIIINEYTLGRIRRGIRRGAIANLSSWFSLFPFFGCFFTVVVATVSIMKVFCIHANLQIRPRTLNKMNNQCQEVSLLSYSQCRNNNKHVSFRT